MGRKINCGVCNSDMVRIPVPTGEQGPWISFTHQGVFHLVGKVGQIRDTVLKKLSKWQGEGKLEIVEVMLDQWGCPNCETIQSYWYRKDGKEGDLFRMTKDRKGGKGKSLIEEFGGRLSLIE